MANHLPNTREESSRTKKVLIVGAGIFGVTASIELARRGYEVTIVNPVAERLDSAASSADISKMVRLDYGSDESYMDLAELCLDGWRQWNREWREQVFHQVGVLGLTSQEPSAGAFIYETERMFDQKRHAYYKVTEDFLRERFPAWNTTYYAHGYFNPNAGWVESTKAVEKLLHQALHKEGVRLCSARAKSLIERSGAIRGLETVDGEQILADNVIVACGAWTPALVPHVAHMLSPTGQVVLHFRVPPALVPHFSGAVFPPFFADIEATGFYGFPCHPSEDGKLKIGNHGVGYKLPDLSPEAISRVLEEVKGQEEQKFRHFLRYSIPVLSNAPVAYARMCLYCDSIDGDFLIDHVPHVRGLFVAAGGSGHGFKFGPQLGSIIADAFEKKPNRFAPRFAWREMRASKENARCTATDTASSTRTSEQASL